MQQIVEVEELYGTYLTHRVFCELRKGPRSVSQLAESISEDATGRELVNLKYRIRNSLNRMIQQGVVMSSWEVTRQAAFKKYEITNT